MRIAIGGISHESSTFVKSPTRLTDFENGFGLYRGEKLLDRFRGSNICTGGFLDGADHHNFQVIPLLWTFAYPGGPVVREDYELLKAELLDRLRQAEESDGPIDGVLLDLHGAMVIEGIDDGDGDLIESVRTAVGVDCPIVVTQDLHGNHTQRRVEMCDVLVGFDTYPHVDMAERGREAADFVVQIIRGEVRPVMALRKIPLFWSAACQVTAHPPMDEAMGKIHEAERRPGILSITLATGFPWSDVPEMGPSVIVVADGDRALASATADEISEWVWEHRQRWYRDLPSVRESLDEGRQEGKYPIILADQADNTGGGSPGDSTEVLRTFLELELEDALILYIVDPEVAVHAHQAGVGAKISVEVGGKSDSMQGPPVAMRAEVVAVSSGEFAYDGPMYAGLTGNMGNSAWLRHDGVSVVVVSAREQPLDPAFARTLGIDCAAMKYIAVKSAAHFRSGFEQIAGSIHSINARAIHSPNFSQLTFRRCTTKKYPFHLD